jgi:hypothetical protein
LIDYRGSELTVVQLKEWLKKHSHPCDGLKSVLVERAETAAREMFEA